MVITYTEHIISLNRVNFSSRCSLVNEISSVHLGFGLWKRVERKQKHRAQLQRLSKKSPFQDFQVVVKPERLLPAEGPKIHSQNALKEAYYPSTLDQSDAFYIVELRTSSDFGSDLSDINAAIMLCLVDSEGNSILERIPSIPYSEHFTQEEGTDIVEQVPFQRGSVDTVTFKGARLGNIEALWIGLESGSWRLDGVQLTVIDSLSEDPVQSEMLLFNGVQYKFDTSAISLGERGISMAELRPAMATELQGKDFASILPISSVTSNLKPSDGSREKSMKEYADLKFSLLIYDLALILTGFSVLTLSAYEKEAYVFLFGGSCGFLYLVLLQRSVDEIPGPELYPESGNVENSVRRPLLVLALVIAASAAAVKYGSGETSFVLTPSEFFVGAAGFWASKVSVLLAAFKPIKRD
ncbi:hypothetical protein LUZ62_085002 [Rhynchospora pubera]|uniref:DUF7755 domain-containing protein n=1 Tax=Rhynchospora pubera TaxID=906938 RepID=A0AAV8C7W7_9POAL|nr:hypothetical protein LUZ62_085002 [Rhynchospora pubera]